MPRREPSIPLFLWIATAIVVHLMSGGGADRVAAVLEDRADVKRFAEAVRRHVETANRSVEVALLDAPAADETAPAPEPLPEPEPAEPPPPDPRKPKPKAEAPKPEPEKPVVTPVEPVKEEERQKAPEQPLTGQQKNRIAVQQIVQDPNQPDNPEAEFIGDQANKVAEQSQARITATDQNDPNPTPGGRHAGPSDDPGNSSVTEIAQSEDSEGEMDRAPTETSPGSTDKAAPAVSGGSRTATERATDAAHAPRGREVPSPNDRPVQDPPDDRVARAKIDEVLGRKASPDTVYGEHGEAWAPRFSDPREAHAAQQAIPRHLPPPRRARDPLDFLGLGSAGTTDTGVSLSLSHQGAMTAIGADELKRERDADGERRRSVHRGSWNGLGIEKWRAAIENYAPSVKPGNQTALNTARVPFATYLNQIHNRLHPIFAGSFLRSLDSLPSSHPMNRPDMKTNLEIVVSEADGRLVRMGITSSSGVTAFDIAALEAVQRASPFGAPPKAIVSPDGNVYLHWEFYRNPYYACSTYFARPFLLNVKPKEAPPAIQPPGLPPVGPTEDPSGHRQGALDSPRDVRTASLGFDATAR